MHLQMSALSFEVSPVEPVTCSAIAVGLPGAPVASYLPARRGDAGDPVEALRSDQGLCGDAKIRCMVLTKEELISSLKTEVRILMHLAGKIGPEQMDYRPTPGQRSTLELVKYLAIMGPTTVKVLEGGQLTREAFGKYWGPADEAMKALGFEAAVAAIGAQGGEFEAAIGKWTEAQFREELDMFGNKASRGALTVGMILSGIAMYRMQLFLYLKASGHPELNTMNLMMGIDGQM
ncbi:MAG TPA: hypothetical protein VNH18_11150 [Bryobacteraceae bacterium]|nr:hypothetical protein [Bryobacteraceae bacterium]